jgi:hypothetical protein
LNSKGKEYVAKQLVTFIQMKTNKNEQTVIPLNWKKAQTKDKMKKCESKDCDSSEEVPVTLSLDDGKQYGRTSSSSLSI